MAPFGKTRISELQIGYLHILVKWEFEFAIVFSQKGTRHQYWPFSWVKRELASGLLLQTGNMAHMIPYLGYDENHHDCFLNREQYKQTMVAQYVICKFL